MIVYQDLLTGDELLSDLFPYRELEFPYRELENDMLWEVDGVLKGIRDFRQSVHNLLFHDGPQRGTRPAVPLLKDAS